MKVLALPCARPPTGEVMNLAGTPPGDMVTAPERRELNEKLFQRRYKRRMGLLPPRWGDCLTSGTVLESVGL